MTTGMIEARASETLAGTEFRCPEHPERADRPADGSFASYAYVSPRLSTRYAICVARDDGHRAAATDLMRARYEWRGYSTDIVREDPTGATLVATEGERIVATVTVRLDSPRGLSVDALYPEETARLRHEGARLCEFTRLAVDHASHSLELLGLLFHAAYLYARRAHDASHLLAEVNPRHVRFYERMLGFRATGPKRLCARVAAPAVLMVLSLDHAEAEIARHGGTAGRAADAGRSLYPYFFAPAEEQELVARLFGPRPGANAWPQ